MALKGTESKAWISSKILKDFEGSFVNGKEIRIPVIENGEEVQIKVTLTAAKDLVEHDGMTNTESAAEPVAQVEAGSEVTIPTQEEIDNVANLISTLNL